MKEDYGRMSYNNYGNDEIDILKLLKQLFSIKNVIVMAIVGIAFAISAFLYSSIALPELYTSSIDMYVNSSVDSQNQGQQQQTGQATMATLGMSRNLADSYVVLLNNNVIMEEVGEELLKMYTPEQINQYFPLATRDNGDYYIKAGAIKSCYNISVVDETEVINVTTTAQDPVLVANMCNALAKVAPDYLKQYVNAGSIEPIGGAQIPSSKSYPNNGGNAMKGLLAGIFLVCFILVVRILLDTKIKDTDDFKEKFDTPVLGEIPLISDGNNKSSIQKLVKYKKAETDKNNNGSVNMDSFQATEAFNSLCNNLTVTMNMNDEKVIVISSPEMSDGKSTVSLNLAKAMAKMGNKVLLMDMDLRRPSIHKKLNMANKNGVINLMGKIENINNCTHKNVVDGLDIIFSGGISPNPSEMLASKKMNDIVNKFKEVYDYIIIDSPPVNVVTDACIISQLSGGIVVVLRSNVAHYDDFKKTVENVDIARGKIVGVVINGVDDNTVKYGKKYKYGYKKGYYKYGYYTSNTENNDKTPKEA